MASLPEKSHIKQVWDILEEAGAGDKDRLQNYLRNNNISINLKDNNGQTALYLAAEQGRLTELTTLIEAGADVNISISRDHINTPIMVVSRNGHLECLQALIKSGSQLNDLDKNGNSALMLAIGKMNCFEALIEAGACVNQRTSSGVPVLALASCREEMQALIKAGANVVTDCPMMFPEHIECIEFLLSKGVILNKQDNSGNTALMYLCKFYTHLNMKDTGLKAVQALLEAGLDVNTTDHSGCTALMMAAEAGNPIIVKTLLQAKADPEIQDKGGNTALMYALDKDCIQTLICLGGVDPNKPNDCGKTALMYACGAFKLFQKVTIDNRLTAVETLLEAGADVNMSDSYGNTALMVAATGNDVIIVQKLLQAKSDPNKQDRDGKTALMYTKDEDCIQALISYGADMELVDNSQSTALILAFKECHLYLGKFEFLLDMGANPLISGPHRTWLQNTFLSKQCFEQRRYVGSLPEITIVKSIAECNDSILRFLVCNGIVIDYSYFNKRPSYITSAVGKALQYINRDVIKYYIANCYLTYDDLKDMREMLCAIRLQWLQRYGFDRCKLIEEHSDYPLEVETDYKTYKFLKQALIEPWPLVKLAFIAVSSALGPSPGREDRIPKTGLPDRLQRMLMFQEPVSRLPVSEWKDIPLTFDPVEYEKLPKPRPLLYYWPVGRDFSR